MLRRRIGFALGVLLLSMACLWIWNYQNREQQIEVSEGERDIVEDEFARLTIPYLRVRGYTSQLNDREQYEENNNYVSYLTSYDSDGLKINGLLTVPRGERPPAGWPAIVFVHGYIPPSLYVTTQKYEDYVQYLARNGLVVFKIDLRGHGESEGSPGGAYYSSSYVIDTLNAYAALKSSPFVDPNRIGLWGHSMAGNVTLRAFVVKTDIPALVLWAGAGYSYQDLAKYGLNDNSYRPPTDTSARTSERSRLREKHGSFSSESAFWRSVAPTNFLESTRGAVQIHHAVNDPVVDIGYSRDLANELARANLVYELYEYQSGGHNIEGVSFSQAMLRTVEFYRRYLTN